MDSLLTTLRDFELPKGAVFAFLAGESGVVRALRDHLVTRGIPRESMRAAGYWKRGTPGDGDIKIA